ncbi:MAG: glycosyltransferase [Oligoflexia bacterium]|nr:glycosyltransferase [Oligoflexia bacterium]
MNNQIGYLFFGVGLFIFILRLRPQPKTFVTPFIEERLPRVSIVVPARNEALNLPRLLGSLTQLKYSDYEVIVIDDQSTDTTRQVATSFGVKVFAGEPLPDGWTGKNWACHQGFLKSTGEYILFTDADTSHLSLSLRKNIQVMKAKRVGLLSLIPTHLTPTWWEKLQGPFQLLVLLATDAYKSRFKRGTKRLFAVGQYLLFSRECYEGIGGHRAIANIPAEDITLASRAINQGFGYTCLTDHANDVTVRMYGEGLSYFVKGWARNFRLGLNATSLWSTIEVVAVMGWALGAPLAILLRPQNPFGYLSYFAFAVLCALFQRRLGKMSLWGAALYPCSLGVFCIATGLALSGAIARRPIQWKNRRINVRD